MCGIAGIVGSDIAPGTIQRMTAAMAHRGPDSEGYFEEGLVHFGHRRLSILDTSARGNQPMTDPTGRYVLIHNGEIYNFREVRQKLGLPHTTETDTEMILASYIQLGPACLQHLVGMWAFAIWDREKQELFMARDRLGIKPLYFVDFGDSAIFGSEVRTLLASGMWEPKVNPHGLTSYLMYQTTYGLGTIVDGLRSVPPGHYATWVEGRLTLHPYWDIWENASQEAHSIDRKAILGRVRGLMEKSIERRLVSDVPVGAFLSGGIDSSAVVALMAQASEQPVDTFSVVFEEPEFDESEWSGLIAKKYNTRHHPILLKPQDFLDALPDALAAMDHPSGDGINSYVVSKVTRAQGVKVALSGLGGDELFGGYPVFTQLPAIMQRKVFMLPAFLRKMMASAYGALNSGRMAAKKQALLRLPDNRLESIYPIFRTVYDWEQAQAMVAAEEKTFHPLSSALRINYNGRQKLPLLSQITGLEILGYTGNVLIRDTDQMSMAHALEVREPFFDHELVEFVMGIPDREKWPHYPKQLLVESLGDLLPKELVHRKKMGFVFPWEQWLRGELKAFSLERIQSLEARSILGKPGELTKIWQEFQAKQGPWLWPHIWVLVVLEDWLQRNGIRA